MTDEERKAMEWLDGMQHGGGIFPEAVHDLCRTLKAMLARPVMPEALDENATLAAVLGFDECDSESMFECITSAYRALYAHLTAPKTKEVEVEWWGVMRRDGSIDGVYACEANAKYHASGFAYTVVRLTGKATVSA